LPVTGFRAAAAGRPAAAGPGMAVVAGPAPEVVAAVMKVLDTAEVLAVAVEESAAQPVEAGEPD
jgi:hypothetical protein